MGDSPFSSLMALAVLAGHPGEPSPAYFGPRGAITSMRSTPGAGAECCLHCSVYTVTLALVRSTHLSGLKLQGEMGPMLGGAGRH